MIFRPAQMSGPASHKLTTESGRTVDKPTNPRRALNRRVQRTPQTPPPHRTDQGRRHIRIIDQKMQTVSKPAKRISQSKPRTTLNPRYQATEIPITGIIFNQRNQPA